MNAANQLAPVIPDALTWSQICEQYPDQWVCVVDIEWNEPRSFHFRSARVVGYGVTRRDPLIKARPWRDRYTEIGHFFTGKIVATVSRFA